jgi:NAD(P)-dependent dehydrogenase (short-subunit alcohol dehydrogenase family)
MRVAGVTVSTIPRVSPASTTISAVQLASRVVLVTGAAGGIGRALVERFEAHGAVVAASDLAEKGAGPAFVAADLTVPDDVERMVAETERRFGGLDVLVCNAGGYVGPVFPEAAVAHWRRTLDVNLTGAMLCIHFAVPAITRRGGGAIVSIASSAGLGLGPHAGPEYAAAKAGLVRLTAALVPLAENGIRVNCVAPHTVATAAVRARIAELEAQDRPLPAELAGVLLEPEEVADAVLELVRDDRAAGRVVALRGGEPPRFL